MGGGLDVHALRHTFATHLSKGGVAPRTAQAAMRHSTINLAMYTYTDPALLNIRGALDALPALPLDGGGAPYESQCAIAGDPDSTMPRTTGPERKTLAFSRIGEGNKKDAAQGLDRAETPGNIGEKVAPRAGLETRHAGGVINPAVGGTRPTGRAANVAEESPETPLLDLFFARHRVAAGRMFLCPHKPPRAFESFRCFRAVVLGIVVLLEAALHVVR